MESADEGRKKIETFMGKLSVSFSRNPWYRVILTETLPCLVVITLIIGVAGVLSPLLQRPFESDPKEEVDRQLKAIVAAFCRYYEDIGVWPSTGINERGSVGVHCAYLSGYDCLFQREKNTIGWQGPYLQTSPPSSNHDSDQGPPMDPWACCYRVYRFPPHSKLGGANGTISIVSLGPNSRIETSLACIAQGKADGDDRVKRITR